MRRVGFVATPTERGSVTQNRREIAVGQGVQGHTRDVTRKNSTGNAARMPDADPSRGSSGRHKRGNQTSGDAAAGEMDESALSAALRGVCDKQKEMRDASLRAESVTEKRLTREIEKYERESHALAEEKCHAHHLSLLKDEKLMHGRASRLHYPASSSRRSFYQCPHPKHLSPLPCFVLQAFILSLSASQASRLPCPASSSRRLFY